MKLTLLVLSLSAAFAGDYSPITHDYINDYYNGDRRSEEREIRQRLLELLRDPEPQPIVIIIEPPLANREQK
jgi:hypothetical protein